MLVHRGVAYFNPDEAAARILAANPSISQEDAESLAWHEGKRLLERAVAERLDYAFETTLAGNTIPALLHRALSEQIEVRIWYVGLAGPELHIARVRSRVAHGGHDIPEERVRQRYARSILNVLQLLPKLTEIRVYDNSEEADPHSGVAPEPRLILHVANGRIAKVCNLATAPDWSKPIILAALKCSHR